MTSRVEYGAPTEETSDPSVRNVKSTMRNFVVAWTHMLLFGIGNITCAQEPGPLYIIIKLETIPVSCPNGRCFLCLVLTELFELFVTTVLKVLLLTLKVLLLALKVLLLALFYFWGKLAVCEINVTITWHILTY